MSISFQAFCAKDHDRVDFTDPKAFEAHMGTEHGRKMSASRGAAAVKPWPWRAPKAPATTDELARILAANAEHVADVGTVAVVTDGLWRYDQNTDAPLSALPTSVRAILEGAMARGDMWLMHAGNDGQSLRVEVGRKDDAAAKIELWQGKVRKVYTADLTSEWHRGWRESKITEARALLERAA